MKNLLNLEGATQLSATQQKAVQGGGVEPQCDTASDCGPGGCWLCRRGRCKNYCL